MMHPPDMWVGKSALDGKIMEHTFKVESGKCLLNVFKDSEVEIKKILKKMLEREKTVKTYIRMRIRMKNGDMGGGDIKKTHIEVLFGGEIRALYSETCVGLLYELALIDIMKDFEAYIEKRDGWVFERVVDLQLYTGEYDTIIDPGIYYSEEYDTIIDPGIYYGEGAEVGVNTREVDYGIANSLNLESVAFAHN